MRKKKPTKQEACKHQFQTTCALDYKKCYICGKIQKEEKNGL